MDNLDLIEGVDARIYGKVSSREELCNDFKPWHKPRKHWIRLNQWNKHILELLETTTSSQINYFSFPGKDALDIRTIGKCLPEGKKLCFYGLECREDAFDQSITDSLLRDYNYISENSKIEPRTHFEDLGQKTSKLISEVISRDPFHIINLDFTDALLSPTHGRSTVKALLRLLTLQFNRQYSDWLLFITTRCDQKSTNIELLKKCILSLVENYKKESFRREINCLVYKIDENEQLDNTKLLTEQQFEEITIISILKMILQNAVNHHIEMDTRTVYSYTVLESNKKPDMLSIALRFKKHIAIDDATQIIEDNPTPTIDEIALGKRIVSCVAHSKDVDKILNDNIETRKEMVQQTKELLNVCGYDITNYPY